MKTRSTHTGRDDSSPEEEASHTGQLLLPRVVSVDFASRPRHRPRRCVSRIVRKRRALRTMARFAAATLLLFLVSCSLALCARPGVDGIVARQLRDADAAAARALLQALSAGSNATSVQRALPPPATALASPPPSNATAHAGTAHAGNSGLLNLSLSLFGLSGALFVGAGLWSVFCTAA